MKYVPYKKKKVKKENKTRKEDKTKKEDKISDELKKLLEKVKKNKQKKTAKTPKQQFVYNTPSLGGHNINEYLIPNQGLAPELLKKGGEPVNKRQALATGKKGSGSGSGSGSGIKDVKRRIHFDKSASQP
jgi:hypothetical protein